MLVNYWIHNVVVLSQTVQQDSLIHMVLHYSLQLLLTKPLRSKIALNCSEDVIARTGKDLGKILRLYCPINRFFLFYYNFFRFSWGVFVAWNSAVLLL